MVLQQPKWRKLNFSSVPPVSLGSALVFDPNTQLFLLFGDTNSFLGYIGDSQFSDSLRWEQKKTTQWPTAQNGMSLSWDEMRQNAVLFRGMENNKLLGDTWLFNGVDWIKQKPLNNPTPRINASIAYIASQNLTILFGGQSYTGGKFLSELNDTWIWDGKNWEQQFLTNLPPARFLSNLVYDRVHNYTLLFGGGSGGGLLNDTWIWDGKDWIEQKPLHSPPARAYFGMAYHEGREETIIFGGQSYGGLITDTWIWDGQDWTELKTSTSPPTQVAYRACFAYFPTCQSVVCFNVFHEKRITSDMEFITVERPEFWILEN